MAGLQQAEDQLAYGSSRRSNNRIIAIAETPPATPDPPATSEISNHSDKGQKPGWKKFLAYVGPGFLVSLAYLDPGNMETDLQAGANNRYELLWVVLIGMIFVLIIQSLAANLGVSTGKHLAELCKAEYPTFMRYCLWILAEVAVIAADIPEVIGTAFALNILFHIPIWVGVIITGCSTLLLLGLQRYGVRKLELLIGMFIFVVAACFFWQLVAVKPPPKELIKGMLIPKISDSNALSDAIALMGAIVSPHNLFLHSALVLSRKTPNSASSIKAACRYFLIETGLALFVAFLINVAIVAVPATVCFADNLSQQNSDRCGELTLNSASFLLKNVLGRSSSTIYGIALLASGQSSTITGTYAGQFIMQGFVDLRMKKWMGNLVTRSVAMTPSLIVSIIGGSAGAGRLIIIASIILSFQLPFTLLPLLKFSYSSYKMGPHKNSIYIMSIAWILVLGIVGINVYFLSSGLVKWLTHNSFPKIGKVFIGIIIFPLMAIYVLAIIYLIFRKDRIVTYIEPAKLDPIAQTRMECGNAGGDYVGGELEMEHVPYREDLAEILMSD